MCYCHYFVDTVHCLSANDRKDNDGIICKMHSFLQELLEKKGNHCKNLDDSHG